MRIPECTLFDTKKIIMACLSVTEFFSYNNSCRNMNMIAKYIPSISISDGIFYLSKYSNRLDNSSLNCLMIIIIIYRMPAYSRRFFYLLKNYSRHDNSRLNLHVAPIIYPRHLYSRWYVHLVEKDYGRHNNSSLNMHTVPN